VAADSHPSRIARQLSPVNTLRMDDAYTLTNARSRFGELVNRARFGRERVILTEPTHSASDAIAPSARNLVPVNGVADESAPGLRQPSSLPGQIAKPPIEHGVRRTLMRLPP
jgi:hypothetical protein